MVFIGIFIFAAVATGLFFAILPGQPGAVRVKRGQFT
jgi:hypothetical protein